MTEFLLHEQTSADAAALADLAARTPDGGLISFSGRDHVPWDAASASQHDASVGVVARLVGSGEVVGAARLSFGRCRLAGQVRPYALLSSLSVHPEQRRRGIGSALARWRIDRAVAAWGPDVLLLAEIQAGNVASLSAARSWADEFVGRLVVAPMPMRHRPAPAPSHLVVRPVRANELAQVAGNLERFTAHVELARPYTGDDLAAWLISSPLPQPVNHYLVAADHSGRLLAGIGLREEGRLRSLIVHRMPPAVRAANLALAVVPRDGEMRNLAVDKVWFTPGYADAARRLWDTARWEFRDHSTTIVATYDPRGPLRRVLRTPPWMPTTTVTMAVRSPVPVDRRRLIDALN
jgi:predicted N-acetyltransferase YhbS